MPFGLAVEPDVYSRYSMCSESTATGGQSSLWRSTMSCHHTSRPGAMVTSAWSPSRRTTSTCSIDFDAVTASSAAPLRLAGLPRRQPPSAVMSTFAPASSMRPARASELKPPKTTVCGAPIRAQASMAIGSSGIIGM